MVSDNASPTSDVTVTLYGTYVFRWTETNGTCSTTDDVTVDFNEDPGANAGGEERISIVLGKSLYICGLRIFNRRTTL